MLIGSVPEIIDRLVERRERFGLSYICCTGAAAEHLAPVVAQLAGS